MLIIDLIVLKSIDDAFVSGFIQAVEGEKDPRNIMIIFKIVKIIFSELNYKPYIEVIYNKVLLYNILIIYMFSFMEQKINI